MDNSNLMVINSDAGITKAPVDEQTKERIHEHLKNEEDVISEEDIANVKTDIIIVSEEIEDAPKKEKDEKEKDNVGKEIEDEEKLVEEKIRNNSDTNIDTSWNILNA